MTLVVGVLCTDGIVVGADGAATFSTAVGQPTVLQPVKKLSKIGNAHVVATSGPVGLGQMVAGTINVLLQTGELANVTPSQATASLRQAMGQLIAAEMQYAVKAAPVLGSTATTTVLCSTILAGPIAGQLRLYQFGVTGQPEEASPDLPFVSVGSGQPLADPFLAFLRAIFWKQSQPTTAEGVFATVWTLQHAIRTNTGGVAEPVQLMTITGAPPSCVVKDFDEEELQETRQAVAEAEAYLGQFKTQPTEPVPTAPPNGGQP